VSWDLPSPRVRELIRLGAEIVLHPQDDWLAELDEATLSGPNRRQVADDPVLAAATRRTNRSNLLHWAAANLRAPGERVPANLGDAPLAIARDLVRRGLNESSLDSYRAGQAVALRLWMQICFSLTSNPLELRELLDVSCRSISAFIDDTIAAISAQIARERDELTRGTHAERRETVSLLLDGAPIPRARAEQRLGYRLAGQHTAAIVWSDDPEADHSALDHSALDHSALDSVADLIATCADDRQPLTVFASAATRWVWVHGQPDVPGLRAAIGARPAVRVALGAAAAGMDGFRRSHLDALTVQRMLARLASPQQLATHDEVELVTLLTADAENAEDFVRRTLGALEGAGTEITEAVRIFIAAQCNASHAAARLYTHRNTLLRRLARADQLLPRPLAENVLHVGAALEILRWQGASDADGRTARRSRTKRADAG
jgi:DNA-binding PucR family transcriptional regulator